jgi:hypothetical protein
MRMPVAPAEARQAAISKSGINRHWQGSRGVGARALYDAHDAPSGWGTSSCGRRRPPRSGRPLVILRLRGLRDRRGQPGYPPIDRGWSSSARSLQPQLIASEWHRRPRAHAGAGPQGSSDAHCLSPQRCRSASLGRLRFASLWQSQRRHGHCIPGQRRSGACTLWDSHEWCGLVSVPGFRRQSAATRTRDRSQGEQGH